MYKRNTEIRHISANDVYKLAQILEQTNSWKKLMRAIPNCLSPGWESAVDSAKKYNNDHIRHIERACLMQNRMGTDILFEEWGTSGRKRPTVANLLDLLVKAELFRAADYVAEHFLSEPPPDRPTAGPAAKIDISLPYETEEIRQIEETLDGVSYPGTTNLIQNANQPSNMNNKDFYLKLSPDRQKLEVMPTDLITASDLMKFSVDNAESSEIPILSALGARQASPHSNSNNENNDSIDGEVNESHIPALSALQLHHEMTGSDIPAFSVLQVHHEMTENELPALSALQAHHSSVELPNLSVLNLNVSVETNENAGNYLHASNIVIDDSSLTPDLSIFEQNSLDDSSLTNVTETSTDLSYGMQNGFHSSENNLPKLSILQK